MKKRLLSLLLAVIMVVGLLPVTAMAAGAADHTYGTSKNKAGSVHVTTDMFGASAETNTSALAVWQYDGNFYIALAIDDETGDRIRNCTAPTVTINGQTATIELCSDNAGDRLSLYGYSNLLGSLKSARDAIKDNSFNNPFLPIYFNNDLSVKETPYYCILKLADEDAYIAKSLNDEGNVASFAVRILDDGGNDILGFADPIIIIDDSSDNKHKMSTRVFGAVLRKADGTYEFLRLPSKQFNDTLKNPKSNYDYSSITWHPVGNWYVEAIDGGTSSPNFSNLYLPHPEDLWDCTGYKPAEGTAGMVNNPVTVNVIGKASIQTYSGGSQKYDVFNVANSSLHFENNPDFTSEAGVSYWNMGTSGGSVSGRYYYIFEETPKAEYKVEHYTENLDGSYKLEGAEEELIGEVGATVKATPKSYDGFSCDKTVEGTVVSGVVTEDDSLVLKLYYTRNSYDVNYAYGTDSAIKPDDLLPAGGTYKYGASVEVAAPIAADGYTFSGWSMDDFTMPADDVTITGSFTANTDTAYKIEHYKQDLSGEGYTLAETENKTGTTGEEVTATQKTYAGFTYTEIPNRTVDSGYIAGDGSLVLKLYYTRNSYNVSYQLDGAAYGEPVAYKYGAEVTVAGAPEVPAGYSFSGWNTEDVTVTDGKFDMPNKNVLLTGSFTANTDTDYKIEYYFENVAGTDFVKDESKTESKEGTTGETANADITKTFEGFTFDADNANNVKSGTIAGDGSLVLKLYYNRNRHTVTYTDGVEDKEVFADDVHENVPYGSETPGFRGVPKRFGYIFTGWEPAVAPTVTGDAEYEAQWKLDLRWLPLLGGIEPIVEVEGLNTIDHVAYVVGRGDNKFVPNGTVTRAEAATMFFRLMTDSHRNYYWDNNATYADVADTAWYNVAVATLEAAGVIQDTAAYGNFRPNEPITRAEMAVMAAQFCDVTGSVAKASFYDVSASHWAADEIAIMEYAGFIQGFNGYYRPEDTITRAECVTIINRMLERGAEAENMLPTMVTFVDVAPNAWYYEAVQEAANSHTYTRTNWYMTNEFFYGEQWLTIEKAPDWAAMEQLWAAAH